MADKKATRESYGAALAELGEKYDFLVLDADLAAATKTGVFKKKFPERFFDCGIAEVMNPMPHDEKFRAFGWHVIVIDAHSFSDLEAAFAEAKTVKGKPTMIIANSVKGKGVSYMENKCEWHGQAPKEDLYRVAMDDLTKIAESIKA